MTAREAWALLADSWECPFINLDGQRAILIASALDGRARSLCGSIFVLRQQGAISLEVSVAMHSAIDAERARLGRPWLVTGYLWPLDADGARDRAAFCARMAAREEGA